jgi:hypothetical protein
MTRQEQKDNLEKDLNNGVVTLSKAINFTLNKELNLMVSKIDRYKILNFISWSDRYYISLEDMLKILLPIWHKRFKNTFKGLGVKISVLAGNKSKEIIKQYIKKYYPNGENVKLYKQKQSDSILSVQNYEENDPIEYIKHYKQTILDLRKKDTLVSNRMQRRKWRGNPFI